MAVSVVHAHVSAIPNDPTKDVSSTKWNQAHTLSGITAFAETILDDVDAAAVRTTIGAAGGAGTASGTNTGDQTSIVGITGSLAEFNTALTGADFATGGGTATGANTGDQSSIVGITGTKAQFDTACSDGNFAYASDLGSYQPLDTQLTSLAALAYAGNGSKVVRLNAGATDFEFAAAGTGDVVGPASSVDNEIARYSGTTGKLIDSVAGVTLSDAGALNLPSGSAALPAISLAEDTTTGWYRASGNVWVWSCSTVPQVYLYSNVVRLGDATVFGWASTHPAGSVTDAGMGRGGAANSIVFAGGDAAVGAVTSRTEMNKAIATIADATATDVFTVTIPNASHSAMVRVTLAGKIGAGGAIGAGEATGTVTYDIAIARTAGVNAVAAISAAYGSAVCAVAGATTITVAGTLGAITGAVGASNTFTIKVTVTKGGGASANHTCLAYCQLLNANATGISIA